MKAIQVRRVVRTHIVGATNLETKIWTIRPEAVSSFALPVLLGLLVLC